MEKLECTRNPKGKMASIECEATSIGDRGMRLSFDAYLSQSVNSVYMHGLIYYSRDLITFQKLPANIWENICAWLAGKKSSWLLDNAFSQALPYSNINHSCPYVGRVFAKVDNFSFDKVEMEPLVPHGRYRLEINLTEGYRGRVLGTTKTHFRINKPKKHWRKKLPINQMILWSNMQMRGKKVIKSKLFKPWSLVREIVVVVTYRLWRKKIVE